MHAAKTRLIRSLSLSHQKKDWPAGPHQCFFWHDTDYRFVICSFRRFSCPANPILLLVWEWQWQISKKRCFSSRWLIFFLIKDLTAWLLKVDDELAMIFRGNWLGTSWSALGRFSLIVIYKHLWLFNSLKVLEFFFLKLYRNSLTLMK